METGPSVGSSQRRPQRRSSPTRSTRRSSWTLQAAAEGPRWTSQEWARALLGKLGLPWGVASVGARRLGLVACGARRAPTLALQEVLPPGQLQILSFSEPCLTTGIGCDTNDLHFNVLADIGRLMHPRNRLTVNTFMMM